MNKFKIIVTGIVLTFLTLTPVHAVSLDKVLERINVVSGGIDKDSAFRFWQFPRGDIRQELKLNIITLVPKNDDVLKIEAEINLRTLYPRYIHGIWDALKLQLNASYEINEDVLLKIGLKSKFYERIKVHEKERSWGPNGLILEIKNTEMFFLPIDMTKESDSDEESQFNYIAGVYFEQFYSYDKYELDLFGLTKKRTDMTGCTVPHCITGGIKLSASHNELNYGKKLSQALRLSYQYHKTNPRGYKKQNLQWEAKLTNCLNYDAWSKLDIDFYIASKAFRNVFEDKKPWSNLLGYSENMNGFYRPRCGIHTILTKKLSEELTFSFDAVLFFKMIINDKDLLESQRDQYVDNLETSLKVTTEYKISKNIILEAALGKKTGKELEVNSNVPHRDSNFDFEFSILVKQDKSKSV
jgi:hypothetical protein